MAPRVFYPQADEPDAEEERQERQEYPSINVSALNRVQGQPLTGRMRIANRILMHQNFCLNIIYYPDVRDSDDDDGNEETYPEILDALYSQPMFE